MAKDTSRLEIELDDKTNQNAQSLSGFIGFGPESGLISGLTNVHPAIAVITAATQALADGLQSVKSTALNMAEELRPYSGAVATAFALNEVDRINMLLERDVKMGDDLAQLVRLQNKADLLWEDIKTQIFTAIVPILNEIMETILPYIKDMVDFLSNIPSLTAIVAEILVFLGIWTEQQAQELAIFEAQQEAERSKRGIGHLDSVLNFLRQPPPKPDVFQPRNIPGGIF